MKHLSWIAGAQRTFYDDRFPFTYVFAMHRRFLPWMWLALSASAWAAPSCLDAVRAANARLDPPVQDVRILADTLTELNRSGQLPPDRYVSKQQARAAGWTPGAAFNQFEALKGKRMGGDHFGNRERRLPAGQWTEADLDYRGGKRNAKRLLFSTAGQRYVTVDHYQTFLEVPPCR